jgi:opacity protein-like surface antigen
MRLTGWVMICGLAIAGAAQAAHPLQTEDTGTQGVGNVEFENGLSWSRTSGARAFAYQPQISCGLTPTFDLIVQPSWLSIRDEDSTIAQGFGDTNLDGKWRFFGDAPLSFAVRAGVTLATSQRQLGIPHGKVATHAELVATFDATPLTVHGNLGLTQNPGGSGERRSVGRVSGALMWAASEKLVLTVDGGAEANSDQTRSSWPATLLAGAIYTIRPGMDVDIGYQSSLRTSLTMREWLVGITYRFAP